MVNIPVPWILWDTVSFHVGWNGALSTPLLCEVKSYPCLVRSDGWGNTSKTWPSKHTSQTSYENRNLLLFFWKKSVVNNGISTTNLNWLAGFQPSTVLLDYVIPNVVQQIACKLLKINIYKQCNRPNGIIFHHPRFPWQFFRKKSLTYKPPAFGELKPGVVEFRPPSRCSILRQLWYPTLRRITRDDMVQGCIHTWKQLQVVSGWQSHIAT